MVSIEQKHPGTSPRNTVFKSCTLDREAPETTTCPNWQRRFSKINRGPAFQAQKYNSK